MITVRCAIKDNKIQNLDPTNGPIEYQVRNILNLAGFKFEDDNKLSAIINRNPKPLGILKSWYDVETQTTHYKQDLDEDIL